MATHVSDEEFRAKRCEEYKYLVAIAQETCKPGEAVTLSKDFTGVGSLSVTVDRRVGTYPVASLCAEAGTEN